MSEMASLPCSSGDPLTELRKCHPYVEPDLLADLLQSSGGVFAQALKKANEIFGPSTLDVVSQPQSDQNNPTSVVPPRDTNTPGVPVRSTTSREDLLTKQFTDMFPTIPVEEVRATVAHHRGNADACFDALTSYSPRPGVFDNEEQAETIQSCPQEAGLIGTNEQSSSEDIIHGMFPMVPRSDIHDALAKCNGDVEQCIERFLAAQVKDEDADDGDVASYLVSSSGETPAPPAPPAVCAVPQVPDPESEMKFWTSMFPTLPIDDICEVLKLNEGRMNDEEEHQNAVFNNLRKRVNRRARQADVAEPAVSREVRPPATSAKPLSAHVLQSSNTTARPTAPVAVVQVSPSHPPNPVVRRTEQSQQRHHYHIFWDYDNINGTGNTQCDPLALFNVVRAFFSQVSSRTHTMGPNIANSLHVEVYIVPASRATAFQISSLRDTGAKIVQCGSKPGDADRQICKAVMEFATMGFQKDQHTVVIMSSDKDFTSCATFVKSTGFTAWCVHDAKPRSNHLSVLQAMYTRCISLHELMATRGQ